MLYTIATTENGEKSLRFYVTTILFDPGELAVYSYLASAHPFRDIYERIEKSWAGTDDIERKILWPELLTVFSRIFIRENASAWRPWEHNISYSEKDLPLSRFCQQFFAYSEGNPPPRDLIQFGCIVKFMAEDFLRVVNKREQKRLATQYHGRLAEARELMVTSSLLRKAIKDGLASSDLSREEVDSFLTDQNQKTPEAYKRSIKFLLRLPQVYLKYFADAIAVERNYLARYDDLTKHLQVVNEMLFGPDLLMKCLEVHSKHRSAEEWERPEWNFSKKDGGPKEPDPYLGEVSQEAIISTGKYRRPQVGNLGALLKHKGDHVEHFLNRILKRENIHFLQKKAGEKAREVYAGEDFLDAIDQQGGNFPEAIENQSGQALGKAEVVRFNKNREDFWEVWKPGIEFRKTPEEITAEYHSRKEQNRLLDDLIENSDGLSDQEKEILRFSRKNYSCEKIAKRKGLSKNAVKCSLSDALKKLKP